MSRKKLKATHRVVDAGEAGGDAPVAGLPVAALLLATAYDHVGYALLLGDAWSSRFSTAAIAAAWALT